MRTLHSFTPLDENKHLCPVTNVVVWSQPMLRADENNSKAISFDYMTLLKQHDASCSRHRMLHLCCTRRKHIFNLACACVNKGSLFQDEKQPCRPCRTPDKNGNKIYIFSLYLHVTSKARKKNKKRQLPQKHLKISIRSSSKLNIYFHKMPTILH